MNIFPTGGRLRRLLPWRNHSLSLGGQLRTVDKPSDSLVARQLPANDSDAALVGDVARKAFADRRRRARIAGTTDLFGEPAWDILLNLFIAACEGRRLSVAAVCADAGAPESTALRWIAVLEKRGMIVREGEREHALLKLSAIANAGLAGYFGAG
jgi:hypothetical protein